MADRSRQAALTWTPLPGTRVEAVTLRLRGTGWTSAEVRRQVAEVRGIATVEVRLSGAGEVLTATGTPAALLRLIERVPVEIHDKLRVEHRLKTLR